MFYTSISSRLHNHSQHSFTFHVCCMQTPPSVFGSIHQAAESDLEQAEAVPMHGKLAQQELENVGMCMNMEAVGLKDEGVEVQVWGVGVDGGVGSDEALSKNTLRDSLRARAHASNAEARALCIKPIMGVGLANYCVNDNRDTATSARVLQEVRKQALPQRLHQEQGEWGEGNAEENRSGRQEEEEKEGENWEQQQQRERVKAGSDPKEAQQEGQFGMNEFYRYEEELSTKLDMFATTFAQVIVVVVIQCKW
jgi:hypothetical protein